MVLKFQGEQMNTLKSEKYISLDEAAECLGIKPATLRSWIRDPKMKFPHIRVDVVGNLSILRLMNG